MPTSISILYCSTMCSETMLNFLHDSSKRKKIYSAQKYHRLFAEGLCSNKAVVTALTSIPTRIESNNKIFWVKKGETANGLTFKYLPFINLPYIRQIMVFIGTLLYTSFWVMKNKKKESLIITDILNASISLPALMVAKIFNRNICAIVTDLPELLSAIRTESNKSIMGRHATFLSKSFKKSYDVYIILTRQMNGIVNEKKRPSFILEGLVDSKLFMIAPPIKEMKNEQIILYSGGLFEKFGVRKLIHAFNLLNDRNLRLHIYGSGEMENEMAELSKLDYRVSYFGVVPNQEIVKKQAEASLLVNPRSSKEEFAAFSFPSKNLEYMVSGTPLVTSALPGMPDIYNEYVYIFDDESIEGISRKLHEILSKSKEELETFGARARTFVLKEKNNTIQAARFLKLLQDSCIINSDCINTISCQ